MSLITTARNLPLSRQITLAAAVLATIVALTLLARTTIKPKLDLLYSGLDPAAAGEVISKLETLDVAYEVKGQAIYADVRRRDALRMELAREGLPRQSVIGYELFDDMNSFAMTSEMFDTAYWRAKEGELTRTILAMPSVNSARVHLGTGQARGFSRSAQVSTASVTITSPAGITDQQIKALQYVVALSVSGLAPVDVAIIDTSRGMLAGPGFGPGARSHDGDELERSAKIKQDILAMMEARVGIGNARVSVSLEIDRNHEKTVERVFDPEGRVLKSQTTTELAQNSSGSNNNVTVASNLAEGAGGGTSNSDRSETTENVTYEISEIVRNMEIMPGAVKRMTIAIMVNDILETAEDGTASYVTRPVAELEALQQLASSAAGLNAERGDLLTIRSFPFNRIEDIPAVEPPSLLDQTLDQYLGNIIMASILGFVILLLGFFVVRPLMRSGAIEAQTGLEPMSLGDDTGAAALPTMSLEDGMAAAGLADMNAGMPLLSDGPLLDPGIEQEDPVEELRRRTSENEEDAAIVLEGWINRDDVANVS